MDRMKCKYITLFKLPWSGFEDLNLTLICRMLDINVAMLLFENHSGVKVKAI